MRPVKTRVSLAPARLRRPPRLTRCPQTPMPVSKRQRMRGCACHPCAATLLRLQALLLPQGARIGHVPHRTRETSAAWRRAQRRARPSRTAKALLQSGAEATACTWQTAYDRAPFKVLRPVDATYDYTRKDWEARRCQADVPSSVGRRQFDCQSLGPRRSSAARPPLPRGALAPRLASCAPSSGHGLRLVRARGGRRACEQAGRCTSVRSQRARCRHAARGGLDAGCAGSHARRVSEEHHEGLGA